MNLRGQPNLPMIFQSPSQLTLTTVEGLGQINKGCVEVAVLFDAFLLELVGGLDHIGGPLTCTEAALTFMEETLLQVFQQAVEEDAGQDLACYGQKGNSLVVIAGLAISFLIVDVDNCGISELLR